MDTLKQMTGVVEVEPVLSYNNVMVDNEYVPGLLEEGAEASGPPMNLLVTAIVGAACGVFLAVCGACVWRRSARKSFDEEEVLAARGMKDDLDDAEYGRGSGKDRDMMMMQSVPLQAIKQQLKDDILYDMCPPAKPWALGRGARGSAREDAVQSDYVLPDDPGRRGSRMSRHSRQSRRSGAEEEALRRGSRMSGASREGATGELAFKRTSASGLLGPRTSAVEGGGGAGLAKRPSNGSARSGGSRYSGRSRERARVERSPSPSSASSASSRSRSVSSGSASSRSRFPSPAPEAREYLKEVAQQRKSEGRASAMGRESAEYFTDIARVRKSSQLSAAAAGEPHKSSNFFLF